jgi:hypothetical protein
MWLSMINWGHNKGRGANVWYYGQDNFQKYFLKNILKYLLFIFDIDVENNQITKH